MVSIFAPYKMETAILVASRALDLSGACPATERSGAERNTPRGEVLVMEAAENPSIDNEFLTTLRQDMVKFAQMQLRDVPLAEDVVQEAIVSALVGAKEFTGRSTLKTWVFVILKNKIIDAVRLGMEVVAEGVETAASLETRQVGCDAAQGFLFAKPMPADDFTHFLSNGGIMP